MTETEGKNSRAEDKKAKIRARYKGIDIGELDVVNGKINCTVFRQ